MFPYRIAQLVNWNVSKYQYRFAVISKNQEEDGCSPIWNNDHNCYLGRIYIDQTSWELIRK